MNTYKVQITRIFGIFKNSSTERLIDGLLLLILILVAVQSVSLFVPAPSVDPEERFSQRFGPAVFPDQSTRNENKENKKHPSARGSRLIPPHKVVIAMKKTEKKGESSSRLSLWNTGKNNVILGKDDSIIERLNNKYSLFDNTLGTNVYKGKNAGSSKLDLLIAYDDNTYETAPLSPSLDSQGERADFDIDLTETGVVVRYLW